MVETDWHDISDSDVSFQYSSDNKILKEYSTVFPKLSACFKL